MLTGVLLMLGGCSTAANGPSAPTPPTAAPSPTRWLQFLPRLQQALASTDPAALDPLVRLSAPAVRERAQLWRTNLSQLQVRLGPGTRTAAAPASVATPSETHEVLVDWSLPGEAHPAQHRVFVTLSVPESTTDESQILALETDPALTAQQPIWAQQPITVRRGDQVAVICGSQVDAGPWLAELTAARQALLRRGLQPSMLVAELPATTGDFERMLGVPPGSRSDTGASTWNEGPATRLVINPGAGAATTGALRRILITHEAVHLATGSTRLPGPLWFHEGFAELVALGEEPEVSRLLDEGLAADQRRFGVSPGLPSEADLAPGDPRVEAAYHRAWLGVQLLDGDQHRATGVVQELQQGRDFTAALADAGWSVERLNSAVHDQLLRRAAG